MNWILLYNVVEWSIRLVMVAVILRRRLMPATAMAWLSIIFFLPVFGLVAYLMVGDARLGRKRMRLHREVIIASRRPGGTSRMSRQAKHITRPKIDAALTPVVLQAEKVGGMPILGGNDVELIGDTAVMIDRLIADIDAAEHHVHMVFYIFMPDDTGRRVADALERAAARGVTCRLLVDGAGSRSMLASGGLANELRHHGVDVREALPVSILRRGLQRIDLRNHRKLAVIDGRIAYTGSQNIVDPHYGYGPSLGQSLTWIDLTGRFTGPVVHQLHTVFLEDWAFETDEILDRDEASGEGDAQRAAGEAATNEDKAPDARAKSKARDGDSVGQAFSGDSVGQAFSLPGPDDSPTRGRLKACPTDSEGDPTEPAGEPKGVADRRGAGKADTKEEGPILPAVSATGRIAAQVVPTGPSETDHPLPSVLLAAINCATRRVVLTSPYFIPDEPTLTALLMAATRGVQVDLVLPRKSDHRLVSAAGKFYYLPLLEAGVHIHEHSGGLLHAKTMTVDDAFALLGSTNIDIRSFYLNFELNVLMYGKAITTKLRQMQDGYMADSRPIELSAWRRRPRWKQYASAAAALVSPLL